jgi:hypothetical protein
VNTPSPPHPSPLLAGEREGVRGGDAIDSMKKIGIKYCGGCNPSYERVEMVQEVQSLLKNRFIFSIYDQQDSDIMLFVCGCPRACANKNSSHPEVPSRAMIGESDFRSLIDWLEGLDEKGDF